jgi:hypothetical protein
MKGTKTLSVVDKKGKKGFIERDTGSSLFHVGKLNLSFPILR